MEENWFFIRGLAREGAHWGEFRDVFKKRRPDANIHCLDLPGNGRYYDEKSPFKVSEYVDFVRKDFELLTDENTPNYLLSMSLGSMVALNWAIRFPKELNAVVCINTSLGSFSPLHHRLQMMSLPYFFRAIWAKDPVEREKEILSLTSSRPEDFPEKPGQWSHIYRKQPIRLENVFRQLIAGARFRPRVQKLKMPFLFLSSLNDKICNPVCTEEVYRQYGGQWRVHPSAGHDIALDDPVWVTEQINNWL